MSLWGGGLWGSHRGVCIIMPRQVSLALPALATLVHPCTSTRKERSDMLAQKTHDYTDNSMACLR